MKTYYKAFNKDMTCRGKQYAENTVFEEPRAEMCHAGMHFCENPFDVLEYYPLVDDDGELITTAEVTPLAETKSDGTKSVTTKLRIGAKLSFGAFVKAGVEFLLDKTTNKTKSDNWAQIGSAGNGAQIGSADNWAKIGSAGNGAQIGSAGEWAKIGSAGNGAQIGSAGEWAKIGSAGYGAQIGSAGNGAQIGSAGDWAQIGSAGYGAQIGSAGNGAMIGSAGEWAKIASKGLNSVVCCAGNNCAVKAKKSSWITLAEWKVIDGTYCPVCVKTEYVDGERIKSDTWYHLEDGEFVEGII